MKTVIVNAVLTAVVLCGLNSAHAGGARYSITEKCYYIDENAVKFTAIHLGRHTGVSNYSCDNAYENLMEICDRAAQAQGYPDASIYPDLQIAEKSFENRSSEASSESEYHEKGPLFRKDAVSAKRSTRQTSQAQSGSTKVQYVPFDYMKDCRVDTHYQKQKVPTLQNSKFGG